MICSIVMATLLSVLLIVGLVEAVSSAPTPDLVEVQPISALVGERVTLSCHIDYSSTANMNAHMALWRKLGTMQLRFNGNNTDQIPAKIGERVTIVNDHKHVGRFMLIINNVSVNDSGIYQCYILRLPNLDISVLSAVNLQVMVPPNDGYPKCRILSITSSPLSVGNLFTLKCTSKGGIPASRLKWYLGNEPISEVGENILTVPRVFTAKDYNTSYTCREENDALTDIRECSVTPRQTTFWLKVTKDTDKESGNSRLKCQINGKTSEVVKFDWFLNGMKVGETVTKRMSDTVDVINSETSDRVSLICCRVTLLEESVTNCTKIRSYTKNTSGDSHVYIESEFSEYFDYTEMEDKTKTEQEDVTSSIVSVIIAASVAVVIGISLGAAIVLFCFTCCSRRRDKPLSINAKKKTSSQKHGDSIIVTQSSIKSDQSQTLGPQFSFKRHSLRTRPISRAWTFDTRCLQINSIFDDLSLLRNDNITSGSSSSNEGNTTDDTVVNTSSTYNPSPECYLPLRPQSISSSKYEGLSSHPVVNQTQSYEVPLSENGSLNYEDIQTQYSDSWESEVGDGGEGREDDGDSSNDIPQNEPFYHNDSIRKPTVASRFHNFTARPGGEKINKPND